jgi:hypothetical protein
MASFHKKSLKLLLLTMKIKKVVIKVMVMMAPERVKMLMKKIERKRFMMRFLNILKSWKVKSLLRLYTLISSISFFSLTDSNEKED